MENFHCNPDSHQEHVMTIRDELQERYPDVDLLFMTEAVFDKAIIGIAERIGDTPTVAYDYDKVIEANMEIGMTHEEADRKSVV